MNITRMSSGALWVPGTRALATLNRFFQLLGKTQMPLVSRRSGNGRSGGGGGSSGSGGGGGVGGCGGGGGRRNARVLVQRNYKLFSRIHPRSGS